MERSKSIFRLCLSFLQAKKKIIYYDHETIEVASFVDPASQIYLDPNSK